MLAAILLYLVTGYKGVDGQQGTSIDIVILSNSSFPLAGADQELICVGQSSSGVNITWTLNNVTVSSDMVMEESMVVEDRVFQVSSLVLCNLQACDSGVYTCNVSNTRSFILGDVMVSTVTERDLQITDLSVVTPAKVGENLQLQCVGKSGLSSPINIEWFRNKEALLCGSSDVIISEELGATNSTSIRTSFLWQRNVQISHSGIYTCVISTKKHCSVNSSISYMVEIAESSMTTYSSVAPNNQNLSVGGVIGGVLAAAVLVTLIGMVVVFIVLYIKRNGGLKNTSSEGEIYEDVEGYQVNPGGSEITKSRVAGKKDSWNSRVSDKWKAGKSEVSYAELDVSTNDAYGCTVKENHAAVSYEKNDDNGKEDKPKFEDAFGGSKDDIGMTQNVLYSTVDDSIYYT